MSPVAQSQELSYIIQLYLSSKPGIVSIRRTTSVHPADMSHVNRPLLWTHASETERAQVPHIKQFPSTAAFTLARVGLDRILHDVPRAKSGLFRLTHTSSYSTHQSQ